MNRPRIRRRPVDQPDGRINTARWLPLMVPLGLGGLHLLFPKMTPALPLLAIGGAVAWSAEQWRRHGVGLELLVPLQLGAGLVAAALGLADASQSVGWIERCGWVALMVGYTSFLFNLLATFLPR